MAKKMQTTYGSNPPASPDQAGLSFGPDISGKKNSKGDDSQRGYTNMRPCKGPGAKKLGK